MDAVNSILPRSHFFVLSSYSADQRYYTVSAAVSTRTRICVPAHGKLTDKRACFPFRPTIFLPKFLKREALNYSIFAFLTRQTFAAQQQKWSEVLTTGRSAKLLQNEQYGHVSAVFPNKTIFSQIRQLLLYCRNYIIHEKEGNH